MARRPSAPVNPAPAAPAKNVFKHTVQESGLDGPTPGTGTDSGSTTEFAQGSIVFPRTPVADRLRTVTINDKTVKLTEVVGQEFQTEYGVLRVTGYDSRTGTLSYEYELTTNVDHKNSDNDIVSDIVNISIRNNTAGTDSCIVQIDIVDDEPVARPDYDFVQSGKWVEGGNVITGEGTTQADGNPFPSNVPPEGADDVGADGARIVAIKSEDSGQSKPVRNQPVKIEGEYGTLKIWPDGKYEYTRDYNTGGGDQDVFEYTLRDGDGDAVTAKLTILIEDHTPELDLNPNNGTGHNLVVDEDDLPEGTDGSQEPVSEEKTFTFKSWDGVASLLVSLDGGTTQQSVNLFANNQFVAGQIVTDHGILEFTNGLWDPATGEGSVTYQYTLTNPAEHPDADDQNNFVETFNVELTDKDTTDPEVIKGSFTVTIVDDVPAAVADFDKVEGGTTETTGNVITGIGTVDENTGEEYGEEDDPAGKDAVGADGATVVRVVNEEVQSDQDIEQDPAEETEVVGEWGTLYIKANGDYRYVRNTEGDNVPENEDVDVFKYFLKDADGDVAEATLTIEIENRPVVLTFPDASTPATLVNEAGLPGEREGGGHEGTGEAADPEEDSDNSEYAQGQVKFTALDGLSSEETVVKIGDDEYLTLERLRGATSEDPVYVSGTYGKLAIIDFTEPAGDDGEYTIAYIYELIQNTDHQETDPKDVFEFNVWDADGSTTTGYLEIAIIDDAPVPADDIVELKQGVKTVEGNVIEGTIVVDSEDPAATINDDAEDLPGADGPITVTKIVSQTREEEVSDDESGTLIQGEFGELTIHQDGSYTYVRTSGTGTVEDVFTYTVVDGDGSDRNAELRITSTNSVPATPALPDEALVLEEKHLPGGTAADPEELTKSNTFEVSSPDGFKKITIGGEDVLPGETKEITGDHGKLTVTFTVDEDDTIGTVEYEYILTERQNHDKEEEADENLFDDFEVFVVDKDDETSEEPALLKVRIVDDAPEAENDVVTLLPGKSEVTGNVIAGTADPDVATHAGGGADKVGADGATVTSVTSKKPDAEPQEDGDTITVEGLYGILVITKATGAYTYTRDPSADAGDDEFEYTLTDSDNDEAPAKLIIKYENATPQIAPTPETGSGEQTLKEEHLPEGTNPEPVELKKTGTFDVSSPDGISTIEIKGQEIQLDDEEKTVIGGEHGKLTVWFEPDSTDPTKGTVHYEYELSQDQPHTQPDGDENLLDEFEIIVKDPQEDSATTTLTITIVDDVPEANDDAVTATDDTTPLLIDAIGGTTSGTVADVFGADGIDWSTVTVKAGATVGTVSWDADSKVFVYTPATGSDATSDSFTYSFKDNDGDETEATVTITLPGDTKPTVVTQLSTPAVVDEDGLEGANEDTEEGVESGKETDSTENAEGSGTIVIDFGVDLPAQTEWLNHIQLNAAGHGPLQSGGVNVEWALDGKVLKGTANGVPVISVEITGAVPDTEAGHVAYTYKVTLSGPVDHPDETKEDELSLPISFGFKDSDDATFTNGTIDVTIVDDVPTIEASFGEGSPSVDPEGTINGTLDYVPGADGLYTLVVTVNGTEHTFDPAAPVINLEDGATLTITAPAGDEPGSWTFTAPDSVPGDDDLSYNISFKITDNDGDTDTTELSSSIIVVRPPNPGTLIVGSNNNDSSKPGDGGTHPWIVGEGEGILQGGEKDDILVGDEGGLVPPTGVRAQIALVLDVSLSMKDPISFGGAESTRIKALQDATKALIDQLVATDSNGNKATSVELHLVPFADIAGPGQTFDLFNADGSVNDAAVNAAKSYVDSLEAGGTNFNIGQLGQNTNYEAGFLRANDLIDNAGNLKKVVFISDGAPNLAFTSGSDPGDISDLTDFLEAEEALGHVKGADGSNEWQSIINKGYSIDAIGINVGSPEEALLKQLTSSSGGVYNIETGDELQNVISGLGGTATPANAANDRIEGGDGNDIIFGDVLFTNNVWAHVGASGSAPPLHSGWEVFAELETGITTTYTNGVAWTHADTLKYINEFHELLAQESGRSLGSDTIYGGAGKDIIYGQEGNDTIYGEAGNDRINGGSGHDTLYGGEGADTFVFDRVGNAHWDYVKDYSFDEGDKIDITQLLSGRTVTEDNIQSYISFTSGAGTVELATTTAASSVGKFAQLDGFTGDKVTLVVGNQEYIVDVDLV